MDESLLYQMVGEKIRSARERLNPRLSQAKLAEKLKITRVSVVNIEAGRQRPPLHLLWKIAEALDTEVALLLPRQQEYAEAGEPLRLDEKAIALIEEVANGDSATKRHLTHFVSRALSKAKPPLE
jgi:transcriptional regulator with XRE-family HTH domain